MDRVALLRDAANRLDAVSGTVATALDRCVGVRAATTWRGPAARDFDEQLLRHRGIAAEVAAAMRHRARAWRSEADALEEERRRLAAAAPPPPLRAGAGLQR